ncbi:MAG: hypothetical protein M3214_11700, partial [Actinomycetota bacterium]|nr:hypothetical protein [Actinomycetota bacterium]
LWARPLWAIPTTAAVAILPDRVRELYGLKYWPPADPIVRLYVFGLLRAMNVAVPPPPRVREAFARVRSAAA